jgi:hypothetical protein
VDDDIYAMASETVRLLNLAIDEETDPQRKAHRKAALAHAYDGEDEIARAFEIQHRKDK